MDGTTWPAMWARASGDQHQTSGRPSHGCFASARCLRTAKGHGSQRTTLLRTFEFPRFRLADAVIVSRIGHRVLSIRRAQKVITASHRNTRPLSRWVCELELSVQGRQASIPQKHCSRTVSMSKGSRGIATLVECGQITEYTQVSIRTSENVV